MHRRQSIRIPPLLALCAAVVLLAGCAGSQQRPPARQVVNQSGYSATFKQGYADGCGSAQSSSRRRDEQRYQRETDYMMGWNDGYSICKRR